jgi:phosphatidylethanolamine-binding protein
MQELRLHKTVLHYYIFVCCTKDVDSPFHITATAGPPAYNIRGAGKGPFVVIAVDPDAPTPQAPTLSQIRHFVGGNFYETGPSAVCRALTNSTPAVSEWIQPGPPAGSDPHR